MIYSHSLEEYVYIYVCIYIYIYLSIYTHICHQFCFWTSPIFTVLSPLLAAQEFYRPPLWRLCLDSQLWTSTYRQSHWEESRDRRVRTMVRSWDSNGISMDKPPRGLKRATFLGIYIYIYIQAYIYTYIRPFFEGYHRCFSTQKWGMDSQTGNLNYQVGIHPANYKLNLETNPWMKKAGSSC